MDEYIDIADKHGALTGTSALKAVIHKKGHYHHTAHIWFYTTAGEILLSQRSAKKTICPLLWDVSVAGHIDAGETIVSGAIRETKEEIGLTITASDLKKIGVFNCFQNYESGIIDNEFHNTYICVLNIPVNQLIRQEEEVEALKLVSIDAFQYFIDNIGINNHFIASNKAYYQLILKQIKQTLGLL